VNELYIFITQYTCIYFLVINAHPTQPLFTEEKR